VAASSQDGCMVVRIRLYESIHMADSAM